MAALTDRELTQAAGRIHEYGDQRLPVPGAAGTINRRMTKAARDHETPTDIRAMQKRWDSIITTRRT